MFGNDLEISKTNPPFNKIVPADVDVFLCQLAKLSAPRGSKLHHACFILRHQQIIKVASSVAVIQREMSQTERVQHSTRPLSEQRVICFKDSSGLPQLGLGQTFATDSSIHDSWQFVQQILDICFVTKTWNILGERGNARATLSHQTR